MRSRNWKLAAYSDNKFPPNSTRSSVQTDFISVISQAGKQRTAFVFVLTTHEHTGILLFYHPQLINQFANLSVNWYGMIVSTFSLYKTQIEIPDRREKLVFCWSIFALFYWAFLIYRVFCLQLFRTNQFKHIKLKRRMSCLHKILVLALISNYNHTKRENRYWYHVSRSEGLETVYILYIKK